MKHIAAVNITPEKDRTRIDWEYRIFIREENNKLLSCYIPGFDLYFSALSEEMIMRKSKAIMQVFFRFISEEKEPIKRLTVELHKKGFKGSINDYVKKDLVKNIPVKAKLQSNIQPPSYFHETEIVVKEEIGIEI